MSDQPISTRHWATFLRTSDICRGVAKFLLPPHCVLCSVPGSDLCAPCRNDNLLPLTACAVCAMPHSGLMGITSRCGACLRQNPAFDQTLAVVRYQPPFDQLILDLKFRARLSLSEVFAALLATRLNIAHPDRANWPHKLIPVPISAERLAERGYNQAEMITKVLARNLGIALDRTVHRLRDTKAQASLPLVHRHHNIRGAFEVQGKFEGLHVGVVDDVMTSGATLNELAIALKNSGAARVTNLIVARTVRKVSDVQYRPRQPGNSP